MKGRPPKPTAVKVLEGNRGRRPLNENEPQPPPDIPRCPAYLTPIARKEWRRIVPILESMRVLTSADMAALDGYCQAYGRKVEAELEIRKLEKKRGGESGLLIKTSNGNFIQNPLVGIVNRQNMIMLRFLVELGLTPSSRARITVPEGGKTEGDILD